ncbi:hypothetical protein [Ruegeria atlantica]|uniref:hypothetical protein n=1 Tax=Ruegeria atlantica TaxID=81569 RepID=UPI00147CEA3C|nr:hypothetical protein [Ruegeria atlantica]
MTMRLDSEVDDGQAKWSEWTMYPKKRTLKLTDYASGFVIALSAFVASDGHHYLFF